MPFCDRQRVAEMLTGKRVAIVGSGPGVLQNPLGFIDSHDVVVRVNNYKLYPETGSRTDVFYSFFGTSIRKTAKDLQQDGVTLCMAKCPNAQFIESEWHKRHGKMRGVDFRVLYQERRDWWFCDTYIPSVAEFMEHFDLLGGRVPTTGFSAILDVLSYAPSNVYLTGFDFFQSAVHNVNDPWSPGNPSDPIGHVPDGERAWLAENLHRLPVTVDPQLAEALLGRVKPVQSKQKTRALVYRFRRNARRA